MMKIGILTFHCAHNYGAVLQAYALQECLRKMGYHVEIVDYRPDYLTKPYAVFNPSRVFERNLLRTLKNAIIEVLKIRKRILRARCFDTFITNNLNLTTTINRTEEIPTYFDFYIFGSDQIWNPRLTKGFDHVFFGKFHTKLNTKKIVYAASMGMENLSDSQKLFFRDNLIHFNAISVREASMRCLLQPFSSQQIYEVLDPALLADSSLWDNLIKRPSFQGKFVLVYQVAFCQEAINIARKIANQINGKVLLLTSGVTWRSGKYHLQCESPEAFLSWIKYADYVVTTSFHGTAFSIVFNKQFYTVGVSADVNTRSKALLEGLELEDRFVTNVIALTEEKIGNKINWGKTNQILANYKKHSFQFLEKNLKM